MTMLRNSEKYQVADEEKEGDRERLRLKVKRESILVVAARTFATQHE